MVGTHAVDATPFRIVLIAAVLLLLSQVGVGLAERMIPQEAPASHAEAAPTPARHEMAGGRAGSRLSMATLVEIPPDANRTGAGS